MNIETLSERLRGIKIVPVIALERAEDAVPLGRTLQKNGIPVAEITFRSAAAIDAIRRLRDALPDILIGAGTVLNAAQAKAAQQAGADFIVSPGFNPNTVKACQDLDIAITPGINNRQILPGRSQRRPQNAQSAARALCHAASHADRRHWHTQHPRLPRAEKRHRLRRLVDGRKNTA